MASKFFNALLLVSFVAASCSLAACMGEYEGEEIKYFPLETEAKEVETKMAGLKGRMLQVPSKSCSTCSCCSNPADPSTCRNTQCCFDVSCSGGRCGTKPIACNCNSCF